MTVTKIKPAKLGHPEGEASATPNVGRKAASIKLKKKGLYIIEAISAKIAPITHFVWLSIPSTQSLAMFILFTLFFVKNI